MGDENNVLAHDRDRFKDPDKLGLARSVAFQGQAAVPLAQLRVVLDQPRPHVVEHLARRVDHDSLERGELSALHHFEKIVVGAYLKRGGLVRDIDAVNAVVEVQKYRIRRRKRVGRLTDARLSVQQGFDRGLNLKLRRLFNQSHNRIVLKKLCIFVRSDGVGQLPAGF